MEQQQTESHHSMHGLPGHPCHELYSRCFRDDADLREYRERQREHGARLERHRMAKELRANACVRCIKAKRPLRGRIHEGCGYWFAAAAQIEEV
jgi:hypothetical protein